MLLISISPSVLYERTKNILASLIDKKTKKSVKKCDVSVAAKSTFLFTSTLDLNSLRGIYRAHLVKSFNFQTFEHF